MDHIQILNLSLDAQTIMSKSSKWRQPSMEDDLKILKVENHDLWILRENLEENSEEISSVALLSPACIYLFSGKNIWYIFFEYICKRTKWSNVIQVQWGTAYHIEMIFSPLKSPHQYLPQHQRHPKLHHHRVQNLQGINLSVDKMIFFKLWYL